MDRHMENAKYIAEFLEGREEVLKVYYPGLKSPKGHDINIKQAKSFGGTLSFIIKENIDYKKFLESLEIITFGESLGGVESLICHPASMTHGAIPKGIREKAGIVENLVRLSIGIEDKEDLKEDLIRAFNRAKEK